MKVFKDNSGREWQVAITVDVVKRVRSLLNIDLVDAKLFESLLADPVKIVDVLYVICKPQADTVGVTSEQFGAAMGGESLDSALDAFSLEWTGFFPCRQRTVLAKIREKSQGAQNQAQNMILQKLESPEFNKNLQSAIEKLVNGTSGPTSTAPPASSESTPGP